MCNVCQAALVLPFSAASIRVANSSNESGNAVSPLYLLPRASPSAITCFFLKILPPPAITAQSVWLHNVPAD
jgi:hypothetical protein